MAASGAGRSIIVGAAALLLAIVLSHPIAVASASAVTVLRQHPAPGVDSSSPNTSEGVVDDMLRLAQVTDRDVVYDLGSLERIPILAAQKYGARAVGVGLEGPQARMARAAARDSGVDPRVTFIEGNLLSADYSEATVVTLDLSPALNLRLEPILRRSLRPGARIVSHRFGIGAWRADEIVHARDGTLLFSWTVPRQPSRTPDIFFVPTPQPVADEMLTLADVKSGDVVYDLGSGDGRIAILAVQKYGARAVGVELDPGLVGISREVARDAGVDSRVTFVEGDLFESDLSDATVVTLYLSPTVNRRLEPKLKRELKPGARIVSRQFDMGSWAPDKTAVAEDGTTLYLWTISSRR
jgi:predicted RNA methylase